MATQIQLRNDTAANFTATNPILAQGERATELDTGLEKSGNGIDDWNTLPYFGASGVPSVKSVVAGSNIAVDATDTENPIVDVVIDTTNFLNNLSVTDVDLQTAMETIDGIVIATGDMTKAVYDTDDSGVVDNSNGLAPLANIDMLGFASINDSFPVGTSKDIDLALFSVSQVTMSGDTTLSFTNFPAGNTGASWLVKLLNGDVHTASYPGNVVWDGGIAPTLTSDSDVLFYTLDSGTTVYGKLVWSA